jgi:hypothetical protein
MGVFMRTPLARNDLREHTPQSLAVGREERGRMVVQIVIHQPEAVTAPMS